MVATASTPACQAFRSRLLTSALAAGAIIATHAGVASAALVTRQINVTLHAADLVSYNLDANNDGITDFTFDSDYAPDPVLTVGFDQINFRFGSNNGAIIDTQTGDGFPPTSVLLPGSVVSPSSRFANSGDKADLYYYDSVNGESGNFSGTSAYVGIRFDSAAGTLYGFLQVGVKSLNDASAPLDLTLGTLVYNDTPNTPVTVTAVPEPAAVSILIGSAVIGLSRRRTTRNGSRTA